MPRKPVVVLDTNVFVSGVLNPQGSPGVTIRRFRMGDFSLLTSQEQLDEISDVFNRKKIKALIPIEARVSLKIFLKKLPKISTVAKPQKLKWDFQDINDYFLLDLIAHSKPDYLVTGDKALRSLLLVLRTNILTPSEFLAAL